MSPSGGDRLTLSVGGGIVADSRPAAELAETEAKASAFTALCRGGRDHGLG
jgi:anthranilate/para-aminobenzoate synthase component I